MEVMVVGIAREHVDVLNIKQRTKDTISTQLV